MLADGMEAADFIKTFVVQAKLNPRGNFGEASMPAAQKLDPHCELAALRHCPNALQRCKCNQSMLMPPLRRQH